MKTFKFWRSEINALPLLVLICLTWLVGMVVVAFTADLIAPYAYTKLNLSERLLPPIFFGGNMDHLLGTDELGRDVLSRIIYGIRISLIFGLILSFFSLLLFF